MSFEEQITSKDKFLRIFLKSNGVDCVYYPLNIFARLELTNWTKSLRRAYGQKRLHRIKFEFLEFFGTALSTSGFISSSVTNANPFILVANVLGNRVGYSPVLVGEIFSHVARLDQSRASENI